MILKLIMIYSSVSSSSPPSSSLFPPSSSAPASASLSPLGVGSGGGTGWWPPPPPPLLPPLWTNVHSARLVSVVCFCKVNPFCRSTASTRCGPSWQSTPCSWSDNKSLERLSCKVRIYEKKQCFVFNSSILFVVTYHFWWNFIIFHTSWMNKCWSTLWFIRITW